MKTDKDISSASGYLTDGFEGVSERFTQLTTVSVRDHNTAAKKLARQSIALSAPPGTRVTVSGGRYNASLWLVVDSQGSYCWHQ